MASAPDTPAVTPPRTALLLTGGGARAAYQVGVLQAIAAIRRDCGQRHGPNPFPIITGTSAGAINAAALACGADDFGEAVRRIAGVWRHFHADQVYRADALGVLRTGARWLTLMSLGWLLARWRRLRPHALLDNQPLAALLQRMVPLERLPTLVAQGHLHALAVTASSYSSGDHLTFFDGAPGLVPWARSQRYAVQGPLSYTHLLASSAIPFVFPAAALTVEQRTEYFGDGSMRQAAPLAPAIHLGADRVLAIGAGRLQEPRPSPLEHTVHAYPTLAQIAGHALSNIFLDALAVDAERMQRINRTLSLVPPASREASGLRPVELLLIAPSERIDAIAAQHLDALPASMRSLLGGIGVGRTGTEPQGAALASYLLFEPAFTRALMALGRADALRQRAAIVGFFGWTEPAGSP